jgi:sterol desaturase/sphingolipid hydroxylase (fatty acid hydroxylase superfamily)
MLAVAICVALAVLSEALLTWRYKKRVYDLREAELSIALLLGWLVLYQLTPLVTAWPTGFSYRHRLMKVNVGWVSLVALIVCGDFLSYWQHRVSHAFRWMWAAHVAHHSSERLNFLAALRQGWTDLPAGVWLFWLPLGLLGFPPSKILIYSLTHFTWQLFVHNEWMGRMGVLENILVTPSHHRVHHARELSDAPKNFGGILIVWDRLFGTFADEGPARVHEFGIAGRRFTGPFAIAFGEWIALFADARQRWQRAPSPVVSEDL